MREECTKSIVLVGSCQSFGDSRNPFDVRLRIELLKTIYESTSDLTIGFMPDLNPIPKPESFKNIVLDGWDEWVMFFASTFCRDCIPTTIYGGPDFIKEYEKNFDRDKIDCRAIESNESSIRATDLRNFLIEDDKERWKKFSDPRIHSYYDILREKMQFICQS